MIWVLPGGEFKYPASIDDALLRPVTTDELVSAQPPRHHACHYR